MPTNLVLSGGPLHDFAASTAVLVDALDGVGVRSTVCEDPRAGLRELVERPGSWDLVTVNALAWRAEAERHAPLRDEWAFTLHDEESQALDRHVRGGGGLLACHAAVICFDAEPRWAACIGATWNWDRSMHPPLGEVHVEPTAAGAAHPITRGLDSFSTVDEVYGFLDVAPDVEALMTSSHGGVAHPVLWARAVGRGRVVTDLLGHDAPAMGQPVHRELLARAAVWSTGADRSEP
jgi:type 1 glutamine amidotransferase